MLNKEYRKEEVSPSVLPSTFIIRYSKGGLGCTLDVFGCSFRWR